MSGPGAERPPLPVLADFPAHLPLTTRWNDDDAYGHVNNATYYEYFDTTINGWLHRAVGRLARDGDAIGVMAENSCRYLSEIVFPSELVVGLACEHLGRSSVVYRSAIFFRDVPTAGPAAVGRFVHVYVDRGHRRPVPVPEAIRAAISADLLVTALPRRAAAD